MNFPLCFKLFILKCMIFCVMCIIRFLITRTEWNMFGTCICVCLEYKLLLKTQLRGNPESIIRHLKTSQTSFIVEKAARVLNLPRQEIRAEIAGLGGNDLKVSKWKVKAQLKSLFPSNYSLSAQLQILLGMFW